MAELMSGEVSRRRETGDFLNLSHNGRMRVVPHNHKSNVCANLSTDSGAATTCIQRSGASSKIFFQCSNISSPWDHCTAGLISDVLKTRRSDTGHTTSKQSSLIERGAGSPGSQRPPDTGPEMRALRGVRGHGQSAGCHG